MAKSIMWIWYISTLNYMYTGTGSSSGGQQCVIMWSVEAGAHPPDCGSTIRGQSENGVSSPAGCVPGTAGLTWAGYIWSGQSYTETRWTWLQLFRPPSSPGGGFVLARSQPGALLQRRASSGGLHPGPGAQQRTGHQVCGGWARKTASGWVLPAGGAAALWGATSQ